MPDILPREAIDKRAAPKRRIMREFRLDEISAVTIPAQASAKAVIMKVASKDADDLQFDFQKRFRADWSNYKPGEAPAAKGEEGGTPMMTPNMNRLIGAGLTAADIAKSWGWPGSGNTAAADDADPEERLNRLAADYAKAANVPFLKAYDHVLCNTEEGRQLYEATLAMPAPHGDNAAVAKAAGDAEAELDRLAKVVVEKTGCPYHQAVDAVLKTPLGEQLYAASVVTNSAPVAVESVSGNSAVAKADAEAQIDRLAQEHAARTGLSYPASVDFIVSKTAEGQALYERTI
jgi:hypothetical protein